MTEAEFASIALKVCLAGLIGFMFFIIWDLSRKLKAGKLATFMMFFVLGLAPAVFVVKEIVVYFLDK